MTGVFWGEELTFEYMTEVSAAMCAAYLGADTVGIEHSLHSALYLIVEARPSTVGIEFVF